MRESDGVWVIESPNDALHDMFYAARVDSADYHAEIKREKDGTFSFVIRLNNIGANVFAKSDWAIPSREGAEGYLGSGPINSLAGLSTH